MAILQSFETIFTVLEMQTTMCPLRSLHGQRVGRVHITPSFKSHSGELSTAPPHRLQGGEVGICLVI